MAQPLPSFYATLLKSLYQFYSEVFQAHPENISLHRFAMRLLEVSNVTYELQASEIQATGIRVIRIPEDRIREYRIGAKDTNRVCFGVGRSLPMIRFIAAIAIASLMID